MLSYSYIEVEEPQRVSPPPPPPPKKKMVKPTYVKTETDYVVMAFVVGTIILLLSDMTVKK